MIAHTQINVRTKSLFFFVRDRAQATKWEFRKAGAQLDGKRALMSTRIITSDNAAIFPA